MPEITEQRVQLLSLVCCGILAPKHRFQLLHEHDAYLDEVPLFVAREHGPSPLHAADTGIWRVAGHA